MRHSLDGHRRIIQGLVIAYVFSESCEHVVEHLGSTKFTNVPFASSAVRDRPPRSQTAAYNLHLPWRISPAIRIKNVPGRHDRHKHQVSAGFCSVGPLQLIRFVRRNLAVVCTPLISVWDCHPHCPAPDGIPIRPGPAGSSPCNDELGGCLLWIPPIDMNAKAAVEPRIVQDSQCLGTLRCDFDLRRHSQRC
jgi:hypothetical protein